MKPHIYKSGGRWRVRMPDGVEATASGFARSRGAFALAAYVRHPWFA